MYTARRFSILILVVAGAAFTGLAATAMVTDHDVLAGEFGLLGLLGFVLAALAPRMQGEVNARLSRVSPANSSARNVTSSLETSRMAG